MHSAVFYQQLETAQQILPYSRAVHKSYFTRDAKSPWTMFGTANLRESEYAVLDDEDDALIALLPPTNREEGKEKDEDTEKAKAEKGKEKAASSKERSSGGGHATGGKIAAEGISGESVTSCYVELNGRTVAVANTKTKAAVIVLGRYGGKAVNFACLGKCPVMSRNHGTITYDEKLECYMLACMNDRGESSFSITMLLPFARVSSLCCPT